MNQSVEAPPAVDGKYYQVAKPRSLAERLVARARDRIFEDFMGMCRPAPGNTILDVGVSDVPGEAANLLERLYPNPRQITAAGLGAGHDFKATYPTIAYRQIIANQPLPFADKAFDIVTSNAVLEHVGSSQDQTRFISEMMRVGRKVFLTVPNRYFPVEHHTGIPLLHWTDRSFRWACHLLGKHEWGETANLILMSSRSLQEACPATANVQVGTTGISLGPCSANLYLYWNADS